MNDYINCINVCKRHGIATLVIHTPMKKHQIYDIKIGLNKIKYIAEYAQALEVNIAIENLSRLDYLQDIFTNIKNKNLGFCYDSGHDNYHTRGSDLLSVYGDRLMAIHLHDNDETSDQHALPGDGTVNWAKIKKSIVNSAYSGPITLELAEKLPEKYKYIDAEMFLKQAFNRIQSVFNSHDD